jgi:hypothetical protein
VWRKSSTIPQPGGVITNTIPLSGDNTIVITNPGGLAPAPVGTP